MVLVLSTPETWASISFSISPQEGGRSLRFGKINKSSLVNREVRIRITSTDNKQYQVKHRLLGPITNQKGTPLQDTIVNFYTVRGSNSGGSLYQDTSRPLTQGTDVLYSSNSNGNNDSFDIIYFVDGSKLTDSGNFAGQILYTVETKGSGQSQTYILQLSFNAQSKFEINLLNSRLRFDTNSDDNLNDSLTFNFNDYLDEKINIYQRMEFLPVNEKGTVLDERVLSFMVSGANQGETCCRSSQLLEAGDKLVYSSSSGKSDNIQINFFLDEKQAKEIEAGTYRGRLIYYLEGESANKTLPVDLEIQARKSFDMEVTTEQGLSFSNVKPSLPPQERIVVIKVKSNLKRPYQVIQTIYSPMTDEKGNILPENYFTMQQQLLEKNKGSVSFPGFAPVKTGDEVIFNSDAQGSPASFKITYKLTPSFDIAAGNYKTQVKYSLAEK